MSPSSPMSQYFAANPVRGLKNGPRLVQRPRKVVAIVVQIDVCVLRSVKAAALAVGHRAIEPAHDLARGLKEILAHKTLEPWT